MNKKHALILSILLTFLIANSIYFLNILNTPERKTVLITEVIDGDTLTASENGRIRLANINTPEKSNPGFEEAKSFLKQFENQTLEIQTLGIDRYQRTLARLYFKDTYLNLEIVKQGLATKFLVEKSETKIFAKAEAQAIQNQKGIWKKSQYFNCFISHIDPEKEIIQLTNICPSVNIGDWSIKDESRKRYNLPNLGITELNIHTFEGENNETDIFLNQKQNLWNNDRDTFYLFDEQDNLVHHHPYGY